MSASRMYGAIREFGTRADIDAAARYLALGRTDAVRAIYSRIVPTT